MSYKYMRKYKSIFFIISIIIIVFLICNMVIKFIDKNKTRLVNSTLNVGIYDNDDNKHLIGEEVKLDDSILKVNNIKINKLNDEKEYLVLNVTIRNIGDKDIDYNPFYFKLENNLGEIMEEVSNTIENYNVLRSCKISSGKEVNGTIVFEKPEDKNQLMLVYKTNMFSRKEIKIKLS